MTLTADDARQISSELIEAAQVIDKYLDANYQKINRPEYEFINESFKTLLRTAGFANTVAVGLALDALRSPTAELVGVIKQAKEVINVKQEIGRAIRLVANLADLAAGIMAKDPNAIVKSVNNLATLIKENREMDNIRIENIIQV